MSWQLFHNNQAESKALEVLPKRPPWRQFLPLNAVDKKKDTEYWKILNKQAEKKPRAIERGRSFRIPDTKAGQFVLDAVNAAIHLRRPLLVTGAPGSGKTSLAYAIAYQLKLGPVLAWPVTARSNLTDALYRYDAIARLQDVQLDKSRQDEIAKGIAQKEEGDLGDYIQLGSVGTAFLPSRLPRVLLIDEIDKSDLNLPNDLLNLFEEGEFEIPELARKKRGRDDTDNRVEVRTADPKMPTQSVTNGLVQCCEFPIVIMTSNGERDFPPAFNRRCLRITMPDPTKASLIPVVQSHFDKVDESGWSKTDENLNDLIDEFLGKGTQADRATDQLLNAIYLLTRSERPTDQEMKRLKELLFKQLRDVS
jgi:MoxR-like ATPase